MDENFRTYREAIQAKDSKDYAEALRLFNNLQRLEPDNIGYQVEIDEIKKLMESAPARVAEAAAEAPAAVTAAVEEESPWGVAEVAVEETPAETTTVVAEVQPAVAVETAAEVAAGNGEEVVAEATTVAAEEDPIDALLSMQRQADLARTAQARAVYDRGLSLYKEGEYAEAQSMFAQARESIPQNDDNQKLIRDIERSLKESMLDIATELAENGNFAPAKAELNRYTETFGNDSAVARAHRTVAAMESNPRFRDINRISPGFLEGKEKVQTLLINGEAMYQAGDWEGAVGAFKEAQKLDPYNSTAAYYIGRIARTRTTNQNRITTRDELLDHIDKVWMRPTVFESTESSVEEDQLARDAKRERIRKKLESISFPVSFRGVRLSQIVETLAELSVERDESDDPIKGVNIVFVPPTDGSDPEISINLRDLNLDRVLAYIAEISNFEVEIREDTVAIIKSQDGPSRTLYTEVFPVDNSIIMRMTGNISGASSSVSSAPSNPFEEPSMSAPSIGGGIDDLSSQIKTFFIRAGIPFEVQGSDLVYDNSGSLIVTNTPRNVERVEQLLRRYDVANMVEVETKFIEVTASDMDEIGFDWTLSRRPRAGGGYDEVYRSSNRTLAQAFTNSAAPSNVIVGGSIVDSVVPPSIPSTVDLAGGVNPLATISSVMGQFDANLLIRAISRKSGTDLMSAPKITMVSGKEATITIAQEFPYPEDYEAPIVSMERGGTSTTGTTGTGAPAVAITAGTPGRFLTRNVGVTLRVTPTVDAARNRISMKLQPEIVEFEGFVEYGGRNIALLGDQQLIAPTGFFQPIFSVRKIDTDVTLWDGATLVMGGLMREEVIRVKDKVPVLGDIPLLGRLFRSEAESSQKRNLLIFVTGNLIGDGGAPLRQSYRGLERNAQFSNPILLTPGVEIYRGRQ